MMCTKIMNARYYLTSGFAMAIVLWATRGHLVKTCWYPRGEGDIYRPLHVFAFWCTSGLNIPPQKRGGKRKMAARWIIKIFIYCFQWLWERFFCYIFTHLWHSKVTFESKIFINFWNKNNKYVVAYCTSGRGGGKARSSSKYSQKL